MPQSLATLLIHLIFSTKNRQPFLRPQIRSELHKYLAAILDALDSPAVIIQSLSDHVHVLFHLSRNQSLADLVEELKKRSSKWVKTKGILYRNFFWQSGYGAFSVSLSKAQGVAEYIAQQEEHHHRETFQEEFRAFLKRHQMPYDERYVWD